MCFFSLHSMLLTKVIGAPNLVPRRRPWIHCEPLASSSELTVLCAKLEIELVLLVGESVSFTKLIQRTNICGRASAWLVGRLRERIVEIDSRALDNVANTCLFVWLSMRRKNEDVTGIRRSSRGLKGACIPDEVSIFVAVVPIENEIDLLSDQPRQTLQAQCRRDMLTSIDSIVLDSCLRTFRLGH